MVKEKIKKIISSSKDLFLIDEEIYKYLKNYNLFSEKKIYILYKNENSDIDKSEILEKDNIYYYSKNIDINKLEYYFKEEKNKNFYLYLLIMEYMNENIDYDNILNLTSNNIKEEVKKDAKVLPLKEFISVKKIETVVLNENKIIDKIDEIKDKNIKEIVININNKLLADEFINNTMYNILFLKESLINVQPLISLNILNDIELNEKLFISIANFDIIIDIKNLDINRQKEILEYVLENNIVVKLRYNENLKNFIVEHV